MKKSWIPEHLESPRLFLRPAEEYDAEAIVRLVERHPDVVARFAFFTEPVTVERERAYLREMIESDRDVIFAIVHQRSRELLGTVGLHDIDFRNDNARIGYILFDRDVHGKGIAQEALDALLRWVFRKLQLNKVYLNVFVENREGLRTDIGLGFQFEGRIREHYKIAGKYRDVYHLSILLSDWHPIL